MDNLKLSKQFLDFCEKMDAMSHSFSSNDFERNFVSRLYYSLLHKVISFEKHLNNEDGKHTKAKIIVKEKAASRDIERVFVVLQKFRTWGDYCPSDCKDIINTSLLLEKAKWFISLDKKSFYK